MSMFTHVQAPLSLLQDTIMSMVILERQEKMLGSQMTPCNANATCNIIPRSCPS